MQYEYKVIDVTDGSLSSVLAGGRGIYLPLVEACINALSADGWRLLSGPTPWGTTKLFITLERPVPENDQAARGSRCIDDVVAAEDAAVQIIMQMDDQAGAGTNASRLRRAATAGVIGAAFGGMMVSGESSDV